SFNGNNWSSLAITPPLDGWELPSMATDGTFIYLINGNFASGLGQKMFRYNPATDTYFQLADPPAATFASTAIFFQGRIYLIGGYRDSGGSLFPISNVYSYIPGLNMWFQEPPLPIPTAWPVAFERGGNLYVAGGIDVFGNVSKKTYSLGVNGFWDDETIADLPEPRFGAAVDVYRGGVVMAGGSRVTPSGSVITSTTIFWDRQSNTWSSLPDMPAARTRAAGARLTDSFYSIGGSGSPFSFVGTDDVYKLNCTEQPPSNTIQFESAEFPIDEGGVVPIRLIRTGDLSQAASVRLSTVQDGRAVGGTSCSENSTDYVSVYEFVMNFSPGDDTGVLLLQTCQDRRDEGRQRVSLTLTRPVGTALGLQFADVVINDIADQNRNNQPIIIEPGNRGDGLDELLATPYPSNIVVSNSSGPIGRVRVTLFGLSHSRPDNLDLLLVGPNGAKYVLMADAGGASPIAANSPVTVTFSDLAADSLPDSTVLASGSFRPVNWETPVSNFAAPAPPGP
ncbi:MAG: hypothetical protein ABL959_21035, partial [Pyrinomonadaceae bacterium]